MLHQLDFGASERMQRLGFNKQIIESFHEALKYSEHPTIDIFLEHKTSFREFGSYLIASTIMPMENPDNLFPKRDWYWDLYNALRFDKDEPDVHTLAVVTLNYDRSFEHFMTGTIDFNVHEKHLAAAHIKREQIRVVHAHGSLGPYPATRYGTNPDNEAALRQAAQSIKVVSDTLDDSPDFRLAQEIITAAENIVFLGFGYNEQTLTALLRGVDLEKKKFFGTAVNLPAPAKEKLTQTFNGRIVLGGDKQDCAAFLRYIGLIPDK
jgi:hypothetical protein